MVETAKVNGQEPYTWLRHVLERLPYASSVSDYEALLPWNCSPEIPR
ncbi:transposase domain-containing protein [Pseudomonas psychrophila]